MDNIILNKRLSTPICTGTPWAQQGTKPQSRDLGQDQVSFKEILSKRLESESRVAFSKHAIERVVSRNVDLSETNMERLNAGVRMAEEKGLNAPLILMDSTAFVVNIKNNRVITVVHQDSLKGAVFTNIDGTVMI